MKQIIIFLFSSLFLFNSCTNNVTSPDSEIDPMLLGEWYYTQPISSNFPSPDIQFIGMQINPDKTQKPLGIEISSGKVKVMNGFISNIIKANRGQIIKQTNYIPIGLINDTLNYQIKNGTLTIFKNEFRNSYKRTKLDEKMFEGIKSNLSVKLDGNVLESAKISSYPSAYASKKPSGNLFIRSSIDYRTISFDIKNFTGNGTYDLKGDEASLYINGGDVIDLYWADSLSNNTITIEDYNENLNRCSGKFSVFLSHPNPFDSAKINMEGIFSLALYK